MLNAERSTLFLNDEKTNELWSEVGQGLESHADPPAEPPGHRRRGVHSRARRSTFPYAYADLRFNPAFDKKTGYLHPLDPLRADRQQARQDHRRDAGAEQARRPVHRRGRVAAARLHGAGLDRAGERQALRRRPEHEELQRGDAGVDVERRHHAGRRTARSSPATPPACASCAPTATTSAAEARGRVLRPATMPGCSTSSSAWRETAEQRDQRWMRELAIGDDEALGQPHRACRCSTPTRSASAR